MLPYMLQIMRGFWNYMVNFVFPVLHVRSIERIYGNKGPDVVEKLFNNPVVAIPVILKRLKQKDNEWRNARREWNKIWREVICQRLHLISLSFNKIRTYKGKREKLPQVT